MSKRKEPIDHIPFFMGDLLINGPYRKHVQKVSACVKIAAYITIVAAALMHVVSPAAAIWWAIGTFMLGGFITSLVMTILTSNRVRFAEMRAQMATSDPKDYMVAASAPIFLLTMIGVRCC